ALLGAVYLRFHSEKRVEKSVRSGYVCRVRSTSLPLCKIRTIAVVRRINKSPFAFPDRACSMTCRNPSNFSRNIVDGVLWMMALFSTKPPGRDHPGGQAAQ
ncbi:MAG TPA: hypothetical protein PLC06_14365, partial [Promineifilum sp.]|nr:hypothetical protein [Promineifilum sp.]